MNLTTRNLLAVAIAILPVNIFMIWYRLSGDGSFTPSEMLIYPLVIGGGLCIVIFLLNKYLLKANFTETFNEGQGNWMTDILVGLGLAVIYFAMFYVERQTLYQWIPNNQPPNDDLFNTIREIAGDPLLMLVWFGPVLWIGVALFEELSRVFMLKCLWNVKEDRVWEVVVIFLTSALIGMAHIYQGTAGAISIGLKSVVVCFYFYRYRRFLPLVISHALYDGLQFAVLLVQIG
ncbi:MAG: CPBP family intramembrane metalloprotease [Saprospiraceae bacterium]|nr:CPBP family intramembrane metalloprotease [Saprospiraceae bacterium]